MAKSFYVVRVTSRTETRKNPGEKERRVLVTEIIITEEKCGKEVIGFTLDDTLPHLWMGNLLQEFGVTYGEPDFDALLRTLSLGVCRLYGVNPKARVFVEGTFDPRQKQALTKEVELWLRIAQDKRSIARAERERQETEPF